MPAFDLSHFKPRPSGLLVYKDDASGDSRLATPAAAGYPSVDTKAMSATFLISSAARDRNGDVVVPEGCKARLASYEPNPVVFFAHRSCEPPVALAAGPDGRLALWFSPQGICSTAFFHGKTQLSEETFALVAEGVLKGASIGFIPHHAEAIEGSFDPDDAAQIDFDTGGLIFDDWELHEWSVVPVPCNAEALRLALDRGVVKHGLLVRSLEPLAASVNHSTVKVEGTPPKAAADLPIPPPEYTDPRHAAGEVPQSILFDAAVRPDPADCLAWVNDLLPQLHFQGEPVPLRDADLHPERPAVGEESPVRWWALECLPADRCELGSFRVEQAEAGVHITFCKPQAESPMSDTPNTADDTKSLEAPPTAPATPAVVKSDVDTSTQPQPKAEEPPQGEQPKAMPYGAEVLHCLLDCVGTACRLIDEAAPRLEQPRVAKFVTKTCKQLQKHLGKTAALGAQLYPDHFDAKAAEGVDPEADGDDDKADGDDMEKSLAARPSFAKDLHGLLSELSADARLSGVERKAVAIFADGLAVRLPAARPEPAVKAAEPVTPAAPAAPLTPLAVVTPAPASAFDDELLMRQLEEMEQTIFALTGVEAVRG
jgi:hypothetical protein